MEKIYKLIYPAAVALCLTQPLAAQETAVADSTGQKVHVAFRDVDPTQVMGSVSSVNMLDQDKKSYTDYSLANMQSLVAGYSNGELWNQGSALVLVDGVPREANNVLPTEIESITFLKGAQAIALYGSAGSKGVIMITTKRSNINGLKVNLRGNAGLYVPKGYPKYLGSVEYMQLYNEARANDKLDAAFSQEDIYRYSTKENPFRYPDVNFFSDDYIKKNYWKYDGQAEFIGGGKYATFYANVGIYHIDDLMNFGEGKKNGVTRLNARGNIDLRLNDWVTGWVNTSASFYDSRSDLSNFWSESAKMRPTVPGASPLVPLIPISAVEASDENSWTLIKNANLIGGKYLLGGSQMYQTNPFASMYAAGYSKWTSRQFQFDAGVKLDLYKLLPGLSFKARGAVDYMTSYTTSINNSYATYQADWTNYAGGDLIASLTKFGEDKSSGTQNISGSAETQTLYFSGQFDWTRSFGKVHNVDATLLAQGHKRTISGQYHRNTNANIGLRAAYNYDQRYYAEFNGAVVHSAKCAPGHRNAFSPVGSLGWRISQEDFLKDSPIVDELRINATYGVLHQDLDIEADIQGNKTQYYLYSDIFTSDGEWWGWSDAANGLKGSNSVRGGNPELTFIERKEFNAGVEASLWNSRLQVNANFFNIDINGLLAQPTNVLPSYFQTYYPASSFISYMNYNNQRRTGFDLALKGSEKFGDVELSLGFNMMYSKSKNTRVSENVEYDWMRAEGAPIDALRGYHCLGFFKDENDVATSAVINGDTKPGDLKYEDKNGDGLIDYRDQVVLGKWGAPWIFGVNFTASYKGFTLYAAGSGNVGGTGVMNNDYAWVYGDRKYSDIVRGRWTKETAETATYPRLTTQGGELNFVTSDFWTFSTDAFYLNQVQLSYEFPGLWFKDKFVKGLEVYVNGNDLLTVCHNRKYRETNVGSTPQTRNYNLGVKINF